MAMFEYQMACGASCASLDYAEALSRWAKVELLKEKVKAKMDKKYGEKLDRIADIVVEMAEKRSKGAEELSAGEQSLGQAFDSLDE